MSGIAAVRRRWSEFPLAGQFALLLFALAAAWVVIVRGLIGVQASRQEESARLSADYQRAEIASIRLGNQMLIMRSAVRGYLLSGDAQIRRQYDESIIGLRVAAENFEAQAAVDSTSRRDTHEIVRLVTLWRTGYADELVARRAAGDTTVAQSSTFARREQARVVMDSALAIEARLESSIGATATQQRQMLESRAKVEQREMEFARGGLFALILLVLVLATRVITRTLESIVTSANAVVAGDYAAVRVDPDAGTCRELRELTSVFDRLALAIEEREQILQSDIMQLKAFEQMKNDFVSTVSHELRTPLTSMRGALGLVLAGTAGDVAAKARSLLQIAHQNTERLIRLINDILDMEKIEAGHVAMRRERVDLASVIRTTAQGLESFASDAGVRIITDTPGEIWVSGDVDRLVQVLTNLVSNAVKFSPRGATVDMRLETAPGVARVLVRDHGHGIPAEFQPRIFGKFQQANAASSRRTGGTGLGLAIARMLVELHGGTISFTTAPGDGTTFIVELPHVPPTIELPDRDGRPRVLIVDDDPGMLGVLQTLCAPVGEVAAVRSAEEAWSVARRATFDALVIDPRLAGENGLNLVRRLRALDAYHDTPVLIFSAREYHADELAGVALSASHVFVKSRDQERELVMRLRAVLAARRTGLAIEG